jgi:hypothetical protein
MSESNVRCASEGRRDLLKGSVTAAGAGLLAAKLASIPASAADVPSPRTSDRSCKPYRSISQNDHGSLLPPPLQVAAGEECGRPDHQRWLDFPANKFYELHVREELHSFHPDLPTQAIWGYDGIFPGPTFVPNMANR